MCSYGRVAGCRNLEFHLNNEDPSQYSDVQAQPASTVQPGSKQDSRTTHRERMRYNAAKGYPPDAALRRSGAKRKPIRNMRHWGQAIDLGRARKSGDARQVALQELVLVRTILPGEHLDAEPELSNMVFVPYRFMSPYRRTQEFGRIFDEMYREYRKHYWAKDTRLAPRAQLYAWPDNDIVALWQARQHADFLGLPYRYYLRRAFEYCFSAGYKRCPAPNQIWRDPVLNAVEAEAERGVSLAASREYSPDRLDPMFLAENYQGHPVQVAAHEDLAEKVKQFPDEFKLGALLMQDKIIPERIARERFGDARVDRTLSEYVPFKPREMGEPLPADAHPMLGCFGTYRAASDVCRACPAAPSCRTLDADVRAALVARYGTDTPRAAKETSDATERKRRQRKRERLDREAGRKGGAEEGREKG